MRVFNTVARAFNKTPVAKVVSKYRATAGGNLYSEQAVSLYNKFFNELMRIDTDTLLAEVGIARHELKRLLDDDEIDEKVERRIENLLQSGYTLSPSEGQVAKFVYEQLDEHMDSILLAAMDAKLYGYSVCEWSWTSTEMDKVTVIKGGKNPDGTDNNRYILNGKAIAESTYYKLGSMGVRYPKRITQKPMQWFEPKNDGRLLYFADDYSQPVEVDTKYKFLLQQHRPTYDNPKGKALLSRVYWLWYFKKNGWLFWSKFLERFGTPLLLGTTDGDTDEMASALSAAHNQSIFTMPTGDEVKTVSSSSNGEAFKTYDDNLSRRISKYLLGQTLTTGVDQGGTKGQGEVHQDQQEIIFNSDKRFATRYVQKFIDIICELNGYDAPEFIFKTERGIQIELAERDVKLTYQGVEFTTDYYSDVYDIDKKYIANVGSHRKARFDTTKPTALANAMQAGQSEVKFTPEQQELEDLTDYCVNADIQPLDTKALLSVIKDAKSETELTEALFGMVGDKLSESEMTELVATALMVADIHGLVDESMGK